MADYSGEFFPLSPSANSDFANILYTPGSATIETTPAWDSSGIFGGTTFDTAPIAAPKVDSAPNTVTAGSFAKDLFGGFNTLVSGATDVLKAKTSIDSLKLANNTANLSAQVANTQANAQANIANANLGIAQSKAQVANVQAQMQLGIAQAQSEATLAAVRANPLASQFVTGKGLLGNLSADGKISLLIGAVTIWLMVRHKHV